MRCRPGPPPDTTAEAAGSSATTRVRASADRSDLATPIRSAPVPKPEQKIPHPHKAWGW